MIATGCDVHLFAHDDGARTFVHHNPRYAVGIDGDALQFRHKAGRIGAISVRDINRDQPGVRGVRHLSELFIQRGCDARSGVVIGLRQLQLQLVAQRDRKGARVPQWLRSACAPPWVVYH